MYKISNIKEVIYDHEDNLFYILHNKLEEKLGFYVIQLNAFNPNDYRFLMKLKNKLDISGADICVVRDKKLKYKELVISYKTIFLNTYNITVFDISSKSNYSTLFRHESF